MFMGEYEHNTDAKGRLIIPAKFREGLTDRFVVTKGLDGCLFAYAPDEWARVEEGLRNIPLTNKNGRAFIRFFFAGAAEVEVDKQGRILIPSNLREYAGIEKEVVSVGVNTKVEIWSKERYATMETGFEEMDDIMEQLSEMGIQL
ncbi:MAG: division/cell wall cluster transcriptional repressor MraZ [Lachnospiraceae bacterium]|jgi:MraZ protein|nr:division/cell wall cluster transcriptional repressor MraZ [Lachnospiraceae bacterium]MBQ3793332.1 division/cell wall cluster transcriptional repressor MraZ [Lachnospiraceae bacterium]MBQ5375585.1 division/cell wall cluster transcriptional repressor MraZ [Lachnospiraceae bacterium]MBR1847730.1 division/cell wall cluster transcriptional repressor MraZ [Lachnospiraceae bacterium]